MAGQNLNCVVEDLELFFNILHVLVNLYFDTKLPQNPIILPEIFLFSFPNFQILV